MQRIRIIVGNLMTKRVLEPVVECHLPLELWGEIISWCDVTLVSFRISKQWTTLVEKKSLERIKWQLQQQLSQTTISYFRLFMRDCVTNFATIVKPVIERPPLSSSTLLSLYLTSLRLAQLTRISYDALVAKTPLCIKDVYLLLLTRPHYSLLSLQYYKHFLKRQSGKRILASTRCEYICYKDLTPINVYNLYNTTINLPRPAKISITLPHSLTHHLFLAHPRGINELCDALNCLWQVTETLHTLSDNAMKINA